MASLCPPGPPAADDTYFSLAWDPSFGNGDAVRVPCPLLPKTGSRRVQANLTAVKRIRRGTEAAPPDCPKRKLGTLEKDGNTGTTGIEEENANPVPPGVGTTNGRVYTPKVGGADLAIGWS